MKKENQIKLAHTLLNGQRDTKTIYELESGEEKYFKSLGTGSGISIMHCLSMGINHKENLWERVFAYRVIKGDNTASLLEVATGNKYIAVEFYELS
jgi:hypothetical protein